MLTLLPGLSNLSLRGALRIVVFVCALAALPVATSAQQPTAAHDAPPPEYGPVSISLEEVPYPFEVRCLPLTMYGQDVRLAYMDVAPAGEANGRVVVLLHGMNFFGEYWGGTMEALRTAGFRVVAIDQIGFGRSSKPIIPYTLGDMTLNIRRLLEHLEIREAAIVGHSMGGVVATRFAFSYPGVATHLALVNQIGMSDSRLQRPWRDTEDAYRQNLARDYRAIRANFERYYVEWDPAAEAYIRIHYGWTQSSEWPRLAMIRARVQQMLYAEPIVHDWPHIRTRTRVIAGAEDGADFPGSARRVVEAIPGADMVLFPGVGHNPHLEAPELFRPALIEFLRSEP
jgi:pimeloyl-ACP methyl ester carboxylesterase